VVESLLGGMWEVRRQILSVGGKLDCRFGQLVGVILGGAWEVRRQIWSSFGQVLVSWWSHGWEVCGREFRRQIWSAGGVIAWVCVCEVRRQILLVGGRYVGG
jgi:hypothetical protein